MELVKSETCRGKNNDTRARNCVARARNVAQRLRPGDEELGLVEAERDAYDLEARAGRDNAHLQRLVGDCKGEDSLTCQEVRG